VIREPINWRHRALEFLVEDLGVSATEYAILLAVLILGSVGIIKSIGTSFRGIYLAISDKIPEA
jgi:Flp pilus assembly pilin Flp